MKVVFPLDNKKAPAISKGVDWREYEGEANTPLIGIAVPDGLIVLDLDTYKGVTVEDVEEVLGCALDWESAELQKTMSGGIHYAFRVGVGLNLKNGKDLLGVKGFDTRSAGKGYIATGEGYESLCFVDVVEAFSSPDMFPFLPSEAVEKLDAGAVVEDDFLDMVVSRPLEISREEVALYMRKLTPEHAQDDWLTVMFGLYHQCEGEAWGWELFDEFSLLCPGKYNSRTNRARWESCGKNKSANPTTFASVITLAGGRSVVQADKFEILKTKVQGCLDKVELSEVVKEVAAFEMDAINKALMLKVLSKQFQAIYGEKFTESQIKKVLKGGVASGNKGSYVSDYIFLTCKGEYMHRETKSMMGPRSFDVQYNRETPPDADGVPQSATVYANNIIECAHDGMYAPAFDDTFVYSGVKYFNTYKPTQLERVENGKTDIVDRILGHIAHLLPKKEEQELVINYLAHNVQFPGKKMQWAMILQGVEGDGKSFLAEMMKHVLGEYNCRTVTVESLDEKFTAWAEGNCMVFIEELKLDNYKKYETLNKLKPYIANPTVPVRRMQRDVYEAINTTNYFALTNFKDALPIGDNDRRYCVLFSQWQSKEKLMSWMGKNPNYYSNLYDDMRENAGEILDYLLSHKIPDDFFSLNRAPDTDAKRQMISIAKSDDFLLVEDALEEFQCWDINNEVINITKLQKEIDESYDSNYTHFPKASRLKNILLDMGFHNIGRYKQRGSRKNQTVYCKDESKKAADFAEEEGGVYVPF
jgi:hypothetical protein